MGSAIRLVCELTATGNPGYRAGLRVRRAHLAEMPDTLGGCVCRAAVAALTGHLPGVGAVLLSRSSGSASSAPSNATTTRCFALSRTSLACPPCDAALPQVSRSARTYSVSRCPAGLYADRHACARASAPLTGSAARPSVEPLVQGEGGVDQREVGEGLGEVAKLLAGQADLLGIEPEVVGVGEHLLEDEHGLVQRPARASASTYQKVHSEKVPSEPRSPSGEASGL